jgi:hypothetical protein
MNPSHPTTPSSTRRRIEREARRIAAETLCDPPNGDPSIGVAREIALIVDNLDELQRLRESMLESLLLDELAVSTDVRRLHHLVPGFSSQEAALNGRLLVIEERRRQFALAYNDRMQSLFDELLQKIQRFRLLAPPDEDG